MSDFNTEDLSPDDGEGIQEHEADAVTFMADFSTEADELNEAVDEVAQDDDGDPVEGEPEMPEDLSPELEARWKEEQKAFRRGITKKGQELAELRKKHEELEAVFKDPATLKRMLGLDGGNAQEPQQNGGWNPYADIEVSEEVQNFAPEFQAIAWQAIQQHLIPQIAPYAQAMQELVKWKEEMGFKEFKQEHPVAEKHADAIRQLQAKGLTYEQALYAAAGKELVEEAKAKTSKRTATPKPRPTIQPGRSGSPPSPTTKGQSLKEIMKNAERQQGFSFR